MCPAFFHLLVLLEDHSTSNIYTFMLIHSLACFNLYHNLSTILLFFSSVASIYLLKKKTPSEFFMEFPVILEF